MKPIPAMTLGLALALCLGACHHQSAAAKAQADYQAKEKALEQQMAKNSKNSDQRLQQLESNCGPIAPGFAAPKTPEDCAKLKAQWQQDQYQDFLPSRKAPPPPSTTGH